MKIFCEKNKCIGCGGCAAVCPDNWELGDDGKSKIIGGTINEDGNWEKEFENIGCNQDAIDGCPVQCIHVK